MREDGPASRRWKGGYDADALVGFDHGYPGEFGQWWTDSAREVLEPPVVGHEVRNEPDLPMSGTALTP